MPITVRDIIKWFHAHFILGVSGERVDCREAHILVCSLIDFDLYVFLHIPSLGTFPHNISDKTAMGSVA